MAYDGCYREESADARGARGGLHGEGHSKEEEEEGDDAGGQRRLGRRRSAGRRAAREGTPDLPLQ